MNYVIFMVTSVVPAKWYKEGVAIDCVQVSEPSPSNLLSLDEPKTLPLLSTFSNSSCSTLHCVIALDAASALLVEALFCECLLRLVMLSPFCFLGLIELTDDASSRNTQRKKLTRTLLMK